MGDKPIIFSAPMVRALLEGRKTQTRRVLKPQPSEGNIVINDSVMGPRALLARAKYKTGDRLYVREAFCPRLGYPAPIAKPHYRADNDRPEWRGLWKPSIHMPRWASRLTLTVTDVQVQRLQDISEADAIAEGCLMDPEPNDDGSHFPAEIAHERGGDIGWDCARDWYADLWDSLHGPDAWEKNPWVVALTFTVQHGNIDAVAT